MGITGRAGLLIAATIGGVVLVSHGIASLGTHAKAFAVSTQSSEPTLTRQEYTDSIAELRSKKLLVPIAGANPEAMENQFTEKRGTRTHRAVDILAPRNTPVRAADNGTVARLWKSEAGGITIYQFDPSKRYVYYYAHLERYADGLTDGAPIKRGQVIGYVGTTGNAPPNTPHLHFAIYKVLLSGRWYPAAPLDPYEIFRRP